MKLKKKIVSLAVVVAMLAIAASGTLAYFTDAVVAHNVIDMAKVDITLVEQTKDADGNLVAWPTDGVSNVVPGVSVDKIVSVTNADDSGPAWIRVYVEWSIKDANGKAMKGHFDDGFPMLTFGGLNTTAWTLGEGGYWYYNEPLATGESTEVLFDSVNFDPKMGNEYQNCTAEVIVIAEAVQVKNNPIPDGGKVTDIAGWPAAETESPVPSPEVTMEP